MSDLLDGARTARSEKIGLTNVRVFDGRELRGPSTVVIDGGIMGDDSAGARIVEPAAPPCFRTHRRPRSPLERRAPAATGGFRGHDGAGHGGLAAIHGRLDAQQDRYDRHSQRRHPRDHRRQ